METFVQITLCSLPLRSDTALRYDLEVRFNGARARATRCLTIFILKHTKLFSVRYIIIIRKIKNLLSLLFLLLSRILAIILYLCSTRAGFRHNLIAHVAQQQRVTTFVLAFSSQAADDDVSLRGTQFYDCTTQNVLSRRRSRVSSWRRDSSWAVH